MATAQDVVNEWAAENDDRQELVKSKPGLLLRWLNQAQLRFAEKSEILRADWTPTITSTGNIDLPTDFLREYADRVKYDVNQLDRYPLKKVDYATAKLMTFGTQSHYSIWAGKFYVWSPAALTPFIPYVKKPAELTALSGNLEIPTEHHNILIEYLHMAYDQSKGLINAVQARQLRDLFDLDASKAGMRFRQRNDAQTLMVSGRF